MARGNLPISIYQKKFFEWPAFDLARCRVGMLCSPVHNKRHLTKCCHLKCGNCSYMEMFAVRKSSRKGRGVCDQRQKAPEPSGMFCQLHPNTGEAVPLEIVTLALTRDIRN